MNLHERQDLKDFLISLYGPQVNKWPMSEQMFNLTYELVAESGRCSGIMDFVPRPMPYGVSPMKYLKKELRGIFLRSISKNKDQYIVCLRGVSAGMANKFKEAALGM